MNFNNSLFVPPTTNPGIVMPSDAYDVSGAYIGGGYYGGMNTPSTYHRRPMSPYQQQLFPPTILYPQHSYYYPHQASRYFYNHNYPTMNRRLPALMQELPPAYGGFNAMWSNSNSNNNNNINNSDSNSNSNSNSNSKNTNNKNNNNTNNKVKSSSASPAPNSKNQNNKNGKQTEEKENVGENSNNDKKNNNKNNNKEIIIEKTPQTQQKSKNTSMTKNAPAGNNNKTSTKQSTAVSKLQITDPKSSTNIVNKDIKNHEQEKIKNDTMQRYSSKESQTSTKSHHNKDQHNIKNDTFDSALSANPQHRQYYNSRIYSSTTAKQRKPRNGNKRSDAVNNTQNANNANAQKRRNSSRFPDREWIPNGARCYERSLISSNVEDNMISHHNTAPRNSTSSEAAGSDVLHSSSSNENLCAAYGIQEKSSKKSIQSRQKKQQQKRKQLGTNGNSSNVNTALPMDIDEESKENLQPNVGKDTSSAVAKNSRKQCTKAAVFNAALNNSKFVKCTSNALTTSASDSSVSSSLSSESSTSSVNSSVSSSASSSPTHSANSSPTASPAASKRNAEHLKKVAQSLPPSWRRFSNREFSEHELVQGLRRYTIDPSRLRVYGFPVESVKHEGCIEIYKCLPKHLAKEAVFKEKKEFQHRHDYGEGDVDGLYSGASCQQWSPYNSGDSGNGSSDSSPRFTDSDSSDMAEEESGPPPIMAFITPDGVKQVFHEYHNSNDKQCVRCSKLFHVDENGEYSTFEACTYHWGKLHVGYNGKYYANIYSCCQAEQFTKGCSQHNLHVWNGTIVGINGPYTNFIHTQRKESKRYSHANVYALDCEMSYTGLGLEVTKVTVVGLDGSLVYEHFVHPQAAIIDYNTRFSGITEKDLSTDSNNSIKTFAEVQQDLLNIFDADTILIGHGLDNDLRVLRLVHKTVVDTSLVFVHSTGYPYRLPLKFLAKSYLNRDIQCGDMGHNSFEDSKTCLELMTMQVRKDLQMRKDLHLKFGL